MASIRARSIAVSLSLAVALGACAGGDTALRETTGRVEPASIADNVPPDSVAGREIPMTSLATEAAPVDVAYVDEVGAPETMVLADDVDPIAVHSAPDDMYTRIGELGPGDIVASTGRQVSHEGGTWHEIIWRDGTAWIVRPAARP